MSTASESSRRWFVTGATSGIGRAIAEHALREGDRVVAAVRRPDALAGLVARFGAAVELEKLDVGDTVAASAVVDRVVGRGGVDVVVNCAGFSIVGAAEELSEHHVRAQLDAMLYGPIAITRAFLESLRTRRGGHVIQMSSMGGQVTYPANSIYHAAKWGLEGFTESVAQETREFGVRFTIVEPGGVRTGFAAATKYAAEMPAYQDGAVGRFRDFIRTAGDDVFSGDPAKLAAVVAEVVAMDDPPLRLVVGSDAYRAVDAVLRDRLDRLREQERISHPI
ncbi:SDR family oxidoreductase [Mycolicibacterium arabiense]|nr:SDR family oxidoreductase [Mycolicibacterium arabiense]